MRRRWITIAALGAGALLAFGTISDVAWARAGGGRSFGGGSRSFSSPGRSYGAPAAPRRDYGTTPRQSQPGAQAPAPAAPAFGAGGFLRGLAGGIAGGFLGSLLFSGLAGAGTGLGGSGGGGIGFLEILLVAGGAYLLYTFIRRGRNVHALAGAHGGHGGFGGGGCGGGAVAEAEPALASHTGHEPSPAQVGSEDELRDIASDIFFRLQTAWAAGDLAPLKDVLAPDVYDTMAGDLVTLRREGRVNWLENIALRRAEIGEAWQEDGREFFQARLTATLLDYVVNEATGELVSGSRTEPARFTEEWTFVRERAGMWRLAAIRQE